MTTKAPVTQSAEQTEVGHDVRPDTGPPADEEPAQNSGGPCPSASATSENQPGDGGPPPPEPPVGQPAVSAEPTLAAPVRRRIRIGSRLSVLGRSAWEGIAELAVPEATVTGSGEPPAVPPAEAATSEVAECEAATEHEATETARAEVESVEEPVVMRVKAVVPPPRRHDPLPPDLERELNEVIGDVALDRIAADPAASLAGEPLEPDTRMRATVVRIHGDNAFFTLGGRNEGVVSIRQLRERPSVGMEMEVVIKRLNPEDGLYEVLVPGASIQVSDWSDLTEGAVVEARITGANTGGLECMVNTIRGFIPASQIGVFRVEDFADYIGLKLPCVVAEVNRKRKNLVLSHRAVIEREKEEARRKLLEELAPGQTREGVVRSIQDFGAFVDIGGVDGLVHISQLSWDRVEHPREVLQEGQQVRVKIEKINRETGKIALSYRDLLEHPWSHADQKFPEGALVKGTVSRVAKFGAFVKLAAGVEGLVHISELAHHHVRRVTDVVNEGQEVEVKVLSVDVQAQRLALSLKAALPEPQPEDQGEEHGDETGAARDGVPVRRARPLKGGFDRPTGGEQFGLKW